MKILAVKASSSADVRLSKYISAFVADGHSVDFVGWKRSTDNLDNCQVNHHFYIHRGWSSNQMLLYVGYLLWLVKLFIYIYRRQSSYDLIYVADFEAALPVFLTRYFTHTKAYIYDIYDEFSIRYRFPGFLKLFIQQVDRKVRDSAELIIHVDYSRVDSRDKEYEVVPNFPMDIFEGNFVYKEAKRKIAITGWLTETRGMYEIVKFIENHSDIDFVLIGDISSTRIKDSLLKHDNVQYHKFMKQVDVFELIKDCSAIFAFYDPSIEINVKAASNKLYDSFMLGRPVITNSGLLMSDFVIENNIGLVVSYHYDDSWDSIVALLSQSDEMRTMGIRGRDIFDEMPTFATTVQSIMGHIKPN